MRAYVFVHVAPGKNAGVVEQLRRLDGIKSADICWGLPDIIALVEAADARTLQEFVLNRVQGIAGVTKSDTHLVFEK
jgi:DNA-binding Lrp family transcriptional regulator